MSCEGGGCKIKTQDEPDYHEWGYEDSVPVNYRELRGNCQFNEALSMCTRPPKGADDTTKRTTDKNGYCVDVETERKCGLNEVGQDFVNYKSQLLLDLKADEKLAQKLKLDTNYPYHLYIFLLDKNFVHKSDKLNKRNCNHQEAKQIVSRLCRHHGVTPTFRSTYDDEIKSRMGRFGWSFF